MKTKVAVARCVDSSAHLLQEEETHHNVTLQTPFRGTVFRPHVLLKERVTVSDFQLSTKKWALIAPVGYEKGRNALRVTAQEHPL